MRKRTLIIGGDLLLVPFFLFVLFNMPLLVYGLKMGQGQWRILTGTHSVEEVISDTTVADSIKNKLRLIQEIRAFAFDELGLKRNKNYTEFYDQKGQTLMYVVTACERFHLRPYQWHYSFLGEMPYKGFFDRAQAQAERQRLLKLGYDVHIGGAAGWSTLGWFSDPILSQMLNYNEGELAELIIHELFHGTLFIKDSVELNENLADFIGFKGAELFLTKRYGDHSTQLSRYLDDRSEEKKKEIFLLHSAHRLDSLYHTFSSTSALAEKIKYKRELYNSIIQQAFEQNIGNADYRRRLQTRLINSGNTVFMEVLRYHSRQDEFEQEFQTYNDVKKYISVLKKKYAN